MHDGKRIEVVFHVLLVNKQGLILDGSTGTLSHCPISAAVIVSRCTPASYLVQPYHENDICNYCLSL